MKNVMKKGRKFDQPVKMDGSVGMDDTVPTVSVNVIDARSTGDRKKPLPDFLMTLEDFIVQLQTYPRGIKVAFKLAMKRRGEEDLYISSSRWKSLIDEFSCSIPSYFIQGKINEPNLLSKEESEV